ncbi:hypothetical protein HN615_12820 [Candidatus Woesearchaeota archaeon]|jgi:hypothetical protein|nr:hypothetical protein [Candidatus Woesearchaeota archaeon]
MSIKINRKKFTELLRTLIKKEIKEASTTATAGGEYDTPNAFQSKGNEKRKKIAKTGTDFKVVEGKWAVTVDGVGKIIVDAQGKGQAKTVVARSLKKGMKGITKVSRVQTAFGKQLDKKTEIKEARYTKYRNDESLTPKQKIGRSMREVRNSLSGLSKLIDMNVKLKNELKIDSKSYWKNTHKAMSKISERLVKLANKVGKLQ